MEIRYSTTKKEVFRWYMKRWKHKLWMYHAIILAVILFSFHDSGPAGAMAGKPLFIALIYGVSALAFMAAFPLLMHKPKERILSVDDDGIKTTMGRQAGMMKWGRVESVREAQGYIHIIGKNRNEFIIPDRAFKDKAGRKAFLSFIKSRV
ncbi:MAG: YcxB family protein [Fibrobacterota bacterium]|nr:YcxB family protein [Fibrobacterota bacterium]